MTPRRLTPREEEVAALVVQGLPRKAIAHRVGVSVNTLSVILLRITVKIDAPEGCPPSVAIARWWGRHKDAA